MNSTLIRLLTQVRAVLDCFNIDPCPMLIVIRDGTGSRTQRSPVADERRMFVVVPVVAVAKSLRWLFPRLPRLHNLLSSTGRRERSKMADLGDDEGRSRQRR